MSNASRFVIRALDKDHDRPNFNCGVSSLNNYIKKQAGQDVKRRISRVFVVSTQAQMNTIVGFYTLSSLAIVPSELPNEIAKKLPVQPVPVALLGRLAVDQSAQGDGVGKLLLVDAIKRVLAVSDEIAIYAIVVDALNEKAQSFYERFGFLPLSAESRRLFLPLKSIAA
jgi:GNAT superfamily N-acetyltransferase